MEDVTLEKPENYRHWASQMVAQTKQHTMSMKTGNEIDMEIAYLTPDQIFTVKELTKQVRDWNISTSGQLPIGLDLRKRLKTEDVQNLLPEERRLLRYSLLLCYHQQKVLKKIFTAPFALKDLIILK